MKIRSFALLLALMIIPAFTGCGTKTDSSEESGKPAESTEASGGTSGSPASAQASPQAAESAAGSTAAAADSAAKAPADKAGAAKTAGAADAKTGAAKIGEAADAKAGAAKTTEASDAKTAKADDKAGAAKTAEAADAKAETAKTAKAAEKAGAAKTAKASDAKSTGDAKTAKADDKAGAAKTAEAGSSQKASGQGASEDGALIEKADAGTQESQPAPAGPREQYADYSDCVSAAMGFSFKYDSANKIKLTSTGACEMTIADQEDLVGLTVSSRSAENMLDTKQILEEEEAEILRKYKNTLVDVPEKSSLLVDDYELTGQTWSYSLPSGETVECASYIEFRSGRYVFYKTAGMRGSTGPVSEALKLAIRTMTIKVDGVPADSAAAAKTASGSEKDKKDTDKKEKDNGSHTVGIAELTGGESAEKETKKEAFTGDYIFDVEKKWLVVPDDPATTVYPKGDMQGAYFVVDKIDLEGSKPADYLTRKSKEVKEDLGDRLVTAPEVRTIELGERKFTGIEYEYTSSDGAGTIYQAEYVETTSFGTFDWELTCDLGDNDAVSAMLSAMETFHPR
ncbi:MAG: hypothetical protein E7238_06750 [Sarcina sp.]|nr:hypothetical protein [Sarcina sp.]